MSSRKTRRDDIRDLQVLKMVREGVNMSDIARGMGKSLGFARTLVARIRDADLSESGEPSQVVISGYGATNDQAGKLDYL